MADRPTPERLAEIREAVARNLDERVSIEPHGSGEAIYLDRDADRHGFNMANLTEIDQQRWPSLRDALLAALADRRQLLAEVDALRVESDEARQKDIESFVLEMETDAATASFRSQDHADGVEWVLRRARTRADMPPRKKAT